LIDAVGNGGGRLLAGLLRQPEQRFTAQPWFGVVASGRDQRVERLWHLALCQPEDRPLSDLDARVIAKHALQRLKSVLAA
jgi:hypothetical protein